MKRMLRKMVAWCCWPLAWVVSRVTPGIRILMFHRVDQLASPDQLTVSPQRFREQMAFLAARYRVVPLSQALMELRTGRVVRNTVVITFDDGYLDNLDNALPVLREFALPATVFVTTQFASGAAQHPRYPDATRLHMNWQEVLQWLDLPGNEVGGHSRTHPYLSRIPDSQCEQEIAGCLHELAMAGVPHNGVFCYPSGDVGEREARLVQRCGYQAAVTVAPGRNVTGADLFRLRRTEITDQDDTAAMFLKLSGAFDLMHGILHWRRQRQFARAASSALLHKET